MTAFTTLPLRTVSGASGADSFTLAVITDSSLSLRTIA